MFFNRLGSLYCIGPMLGQNRSRCRLCIVFLFSRYGRIGAVGNGGICYYKVVYLVWRKVVLGNNVLLYVVNFALINTAF